MLTNENLIDVLIRVDKTENSTASEWMISLHVIHYILELHSAVLISSPKSTQQIELMFNESFIMYKVSYIN